jgi:iron complex outermembrane receptor protein
VDAYEIGAKTTFHGPIPGTFNIALFYNELSDQQLQLGLNPGTVPGSNPPETTPGSPTTAIINAGESTIQGIELETTLKLLEPLTFNLGYTYLETHLDTLNFPDIPGWQTFPSAVEGGHLTFAPRHTVVTGLSYELPFPEEVGKVSAGANYTFTSSQNSSSPEGSPYTSR